MSNYTDKTTATPALGDFASALEEVLHKGAQEMLQVAVEIEVQQYIEKHQEELDENGHRIVVRNGYLPERELLTGIGPVQVKQPRIDDRKLRKKTEGTEGFSSRILPRYLRRIPSMSTDRENVMGKGPIWDRENVTPPSPQKELNEAVSLGLACCRTTSSMDDPERVSREFSPSCSFGSSLRYPSRRPSCRQCPSGRQGDGPFRRVARRRIHPKASGPRWRTPA